MKVELHVILVNTVCELLYVSYYAVDMRKEVVLSVLIDAVCQIRYEMGKLKQTLWSSIMIGRCVGSMVIKLHS
jgi:hypothetical protein